MKKRLIMALLSFAMVCTTVNMATVKANAMTEEEIIAYLKANHDDIEYGGAWYSSTFPYA